MAAVRTEQSPLRSNADTHPRVASHPCGEQSRVLNPSLLQSHLQQQRSLVAEAAAFLETESKAVPVPAGMRRSTTPKDQTNRAVERMKHRQSITNP